MKKEILSIIIPAHNEEATIAELLNKVIEAPLIIDKEIIVVENGSTDDTLEILEAMSQDFNIKVFTLPKGVKGKSVAVRKGIKEATGTIIIIQDADLEYDPNDYQKLIDPILNEETSVVYGSRRLEKKNKQHSHFMFYLGGNMLTTAANFLYPGLDITDEATCYKVFKADVIKKMPLKSMRFEFCPEVTAWTYKRGYKIKELPIKYYPRSKKEGKKIMWTDGVEAVWVLLKLSNLRREAQRFIIIGGIGALINMWGTYFLTEKIGLWYMHSLIIAILVAAVFTFLGYRMWAFKRD